MNAQRPRNRAHLPAMDNESEGQDYRQRGRDLQLRRSAQGFKSARQFWEAAKDETHLSRGAIQRAEAGHASNNTYNTLEAWLSREEAEAGMDSGAPAGPIKLTLHGVYGVDEIIVEGPVDRPDELAEAVGKILDRLKQRDEDS